MLNLSRLLPLLLLFAPLALRAGPWPDDIARWSEAKKAAQRSAGAALQAALAAAFRSGKTRHTIPPGNYRFAQPFPGSQGSAIMFNGVKNFALDGLGAQLFIEWLPGSGYALGAILIEWNTIVRPRGSGVSVRSADRVRISRNTFDGCGSFPWTGRGRQPEHYGRPVGIYERASNVEVQDNQVVNTGPYSLDQ